MKFLIPILMLISFSCVAQQNNNKTKSRTALESIILTFKKESLYSNDVDWDKLEKQVYSRFIDVDSIESIIKPVQYMMGELGDFHGFFVVNGIPYNTDKVKIRNVKYDYTSLEFKEKQKRFVSKKRLEKEISSEIINDSIAYIEIPYIINNQGLDSINISYTKKIRKAICELAIKNPKGYIIDLRRNLGGTVFPMLSGLGELFPNLDLGGGTVDQKTVDTKWYMKEGIFYMGDYGLSNLPKLSCNIVTNDVPIVVLIGRYTASSGEIVASALKGQQQIILMGEQTQGYSTTNGWFPINENISVNPSIAYYSSINGDVHKDGVIPDIFIEDEVNVDKPTSGIIIENAVSWIIQNIK